MVRLNVVILSVITLLQNSAFQPSRGRLLYIHTVVQLLSRFVTKSSTSIKPSIKVRNLTYYINNWGTFMMLTAP